MLNPGTHIPEDLLAAYLLGKLTDAEHRSAENHLSECGDCEQRATDTALQDSLVTLLRSASVRANGPAPKAAFDATTLQVQLQSTPGGETSCLGDLLHNAVEEPAPPQNLIGHARYRVIRRLGWGGMGTVWLAEHLVMGRPVALKVIRPELSAKIQTIERFRREVLAAAKLQHSNIAAAFDAEQIGDSHFLVMEYLDGQSLAECVANGPMPIPDACRAIRDAAAGLAHAHSAGLVHRDVKPGNLMRTTDGTVKVLDFGLVVFVEDDTTITSENLVMGTPDYVAPEQAEDPHNADARSDIYSLGCTLYHLLAGHVPFAGTSAVKKIDAHRRTDPERIAILPMALWGVVAKMMAKNPADRFTSALDVVTVLSPFCDERSVGESGGVRVLEGRPVGRPRRSWKIAAGVLIMLAIAAAVYRIQTDRGELVITTEGEDVEVIIKKKGKIVEILDTKSQNKIVLRSGTYELELNGKPSGLKIDLERVTLKRGTEIVARIERVVKPSEVIDLNPDSPELKLLHRDEWDRHAYCVAISPDGKYYGATGDAGGGTARVWEMATGKVVHTVPGAGWLAFSADSRRVIANQLTPMVRVWDLESKKSVQQFGGVRKSIHGAETPDGRFLLSGGDEKSLQLFSSETRREIAVLNTAGSAPVFSLSRDGKTMLVHDYRGDDPLIRLIDLPSLKERRTWKHPNWSGGITVLAANSKEFCTCFGTNEFSRSIFFWKIDQDEVVWKLTLPHGGIKSGGISSDLKWMIFTIDQQRRLYLLNLETGRVTAHYDMDRGSIGIHAFSPDNRRVVVATHGPSTVYVFELPTEVKPPAIDYTPPERAKFVPETALGLAQIKAVTDYRECHGLELAALRQWFATLPAGFRPLDLTFRAGSIPARFDAVAIRDARLIKWEPHFDLDRTGPPNLQDWERTPRDTWSLRIACPFQEGKDKPRHHIWFLNNEPWTCFGTTLGQLDGHLARWKNGFMRPVRFFRDAEGPPSDPKRHFGVILEPDLGLDWTLYPELSADDLIAKLAQSRKKGDRPDAFGGFSVGENRRFALSVVPNPTGIAWEARVNMTVAEFEAATKEQQRLGRRPMAVTSEDDSGKIRYSAVWIEYAPGK